MKTLTPNGQKWLKCAHLFFAALWVGGAVTVVLMNFFLHAQDGQALYGTNLAKKFVDDLIIIPGAMGCLLTGLIYSLFTPWGWIKHRWIALKWVINLFGVIFGTFWLGPWLNSLPEISRTQGLAALGNGAYQHSQDMLAVWGTAQMLTIVFAAFLSVWKPWRAKVTPQGV